MIFLVLVQDLCKCSVQYDIDLSARSITETSCNRVSIDLRIKEVAEAHVLCFSSLDLEIDEFSSFFVSRRRNGVSEWHRHFTEAGYFGVDLEGEENTQLSSLLL